MRRARTADVTMIKSLVDGYAGRVLLAKEIVTLYESVQEFLVAEVENEDGVEVVGCGALHVLWADLGEIRTVAVHPRVLGRGVGHAIVAGLIENARELGLARLFVLTFEKHFFGRHGSGLFGRCQRLRQFVDAPAHMVAVDPVVGTDEFQRLATIHRIVVAVL